MSEVQEYLFKHDREYQAAREVASEATVTIGSKLNEVEAYAKFLGNFVKLGRDIEDRIKDRAAFDENATLAHQQAAALFEAMKKIRSEVTARKSAETLMAQIVETETNLRLNNIVNGGN